MNRRALQNCTNVKHLAVAPRFKPINSTIERDQLTLHIRNQRSKLKAAAATMTPLNQGHYPSIATDIQRLRGLYQSIPTIFSIFYSAWLQDAI